MNTDSISINLIKTAISSPNFAELSLGEQTHESALRFVREIVPYTTDVQWITDMISAGLPMDYDGNTLKEVNDMVQWSLDKGLHEQQEEEKKSVPQMLVDLVRNKECTLFHDNMSKAYITFVEDEIYKTHALGSTLAKRQLTRLFYKEYGRAINPQQFKQALELLEAMALFDEPEQLISLRLGVHEQSIIINLANKDGEVVVIDKNGFKVLKHSPLKFVTSAAMAPIPRPITGDDDILKAFQDLLGLNDLVFARVLAFIINCLNPNGPYLCLMVQGEQGSGKSFLTESCKALVDPSIAPKIRLPNNERDLMIQAKDNMVLLFDNISGISPDISDTLCTLSTGGGLLTRKLYSDDELVIFSQKRPFILNGISSYATRPDLLERSISIQLHPMNQNSRKGENDMRDAFESMRPALFAKFCDIVSCALRHLDSTPTPTSVRMADAARWLNAAEPATGLPPGTLLNALQQSQKEILMESLAQNSLAVALFKLVSLRRFKGRISDLFVAIENYRPTRQDRSFPSTPAHLSRSLTMLRKPLETVGIIVENGHKTRTGKQIEIYLADEYQELISNVEQPYRTPTPEGGIEV